MVHTLIKKVTFAALLAMFFCGASWAGTVTTEGITLSLGGSAYPVNKASIEANWEPVLAESYIATSRWDSVENCYVIAATGMDGETKVILKDKTGAENHLVFNVKVSTIDMTKHVIKSDPEGNTATVEVVSHYLVNHPKTASRALFLGTLCNSHAGSSDAMMAAISNAINAVATKATVDYHLFYDAPEDGDWNSVVGTVNQNERLSASDIYSKIDNGHHSALGQFYEVLETVITGSKSYDYIVMEFDGNLLARPGGSHSPTYSYKADREDKIARFLLRYYDLGRVFWLVHKHTSTETDQLDDTLYFRPVQYAKQKMDENLWKGLIALLNPDLYIDYDTSRFDTITKSGTKYYAGHQITGGIGNESEKHWTTYNEASTIGATLTKMMTDRRVNAIVTDVVNPNLTVGDVRYYMSTTKLEPRTWTQVPTDGVTMSWSKNGNCVTGVIHDVSFETWTKLEFDVTATDAFFNPNEFWCVGTDASGVSSYDPNINPTNSAVCGPALTEAFDSSNKVYAVTNASTTVYWTHQTPLIYVDNKPQDPSALPTPPGPTDPSDNDTGVKNVIKVYDGIPTNLVINVTTPATGSTITYSLDNWETTTMENPTSTHQGGDRIWYAIEAPGYRSVSNYAFVVILPRPVTLTAASAKKTYDGTELTTNALEVTAGSFVAGEGIAVTNCTGTITDKGTKPNVPGYELKSNTKVGDYTFTKINGTLEIEPRTIDVVEITGKSGTKTYNGAEQSVSGYDVDCADTLYKGEYLKFTGTDVAKGTNAQKDKYPMGLVDTQFTNTNENFKVTTITVTDGGLTINPLSGVKVDIEGNKDTKEYNGEDQSVTGYTVTPEGTLLTADMISGPAQEAAIATGKDASETPYTMGLKADQFSCSSGNFKDVQFNISDGELMINPKTGVKVTITGNTKTETYDGTEKTVEGYTFSSDDPLYVETMVKFSGTKTASGTDPAEYKMGLAKSQFSNDDPNYDEVEFIVEDGKLTINPLSFTLDAGGGVEKFYDSDPTNLLVKIVEDLPPAVTPEFYYSYSPTGPFVPAKDFTGPTNVLESSDVTCRVIIPGTTNDVTAKVTIKKRPVTLVAGSDKKVFDNTPLTCGTFTVKEDETTPGYGFVKNEGVDSVEMTAASTRTEVGSALNVIDPTKIVFKTASDKTLASNYDVTCENGKLTVTGAVLSPAITTFKGPYDADPHQVTVDPSSVPGATIEYALSPEGPWQTGVIPFTDATNVIVYVKVTKENFEPFKAPVELTITKRPITLEGPDKETTADKVNAVKPLSFTKDEIKVGGSLFAKDETFTYADFASIYTVGKTKSVFTWTDGTAKVANYEVTLLDDHYLTVKPSAKQIEVRSLDGKWTYDGNAHGAGMVTNNVDQLTAGDELAVNFHGVTVTDTGVKSNTFDVAIMRDGEDVTASYADRLVAITGVLEVVNAKFTDIEVLAPVINKVYDAKETNVTVTVTKPVEDLQKRYCVEGGDWSDVAPVFTDVTNAVVWYAVSAKNHDAYTNSTTVTILPRAVTLVSADSAKKANGSALTTDVSKITKKGFVKGEETGVTFDELASITDPGSTNAAFKAVFDEVKAKAGNYAVTYEYGTLHVYEGSKITIAAQSHVFEYTGEAEYWKKYITDPNPNDELDDPSHKIKTVKFKSTSKISKPSEGEVPNEIESVTIVDGSDADITSTYASRLVFVPGVLTMRKGSLEGVPKADDVVKIYDAESTNVVVTVDSKMLMDPSAPVTVTWSVLPTGPFTAMKPTFRDVVEQTVYFKVEVPEYEDYYGSANVTILRRPVKLVSAGATKPYDKTPLTTNDVWVAEQVEGVNYALAEGDKLDTYTCSGSQTVVGKAWNQFTFKVVNTSSTDVGKNYDFSFDYGILEVTPANQKWNPPGGGDPEGTPFDYIGMYDGAPHTVTPFTVTEPATGAKITYSTNQVDWTDSADDYARTDVCTKVPVYFKSVAENYADVVTNGYITITQRVVTVKSGTEVFTYNGHAQSNVTVTVTGTDFVAGEGATYSNFKTVTNVSDSGTKNNTFDFALNSNTKPDNYTITKEYGSLTVMPAKISPPKKGPGEDPNEPLGPNDPDPDVKPEDGPRAWGRCVVKEYDGKGTNIVVTTKNIAGGEKIRYALAKEGQYYDDLQFTNVTYGVDGKLGATNVWFEVSGLVGNNYIALTNSATVTITPRVIDDPEDPEDPSDPLYGRSAVRVNDTNMTYSAEGSAAAPRPTSYKGGKGLSEGDSIELDPDYVNTVWTKGTYTGAISTNDTHKLVIRDAAGEDVTANYAIRFYPGTLTIGFGGMTIGPEGPVQHPPAGEPPMPFTSPNDLCPTNGARSVEKTYDGIPTNIEVKVSVPANAEIRYSKDGVTFYTPAEFASLQYVNVTNKAPVWYEAKDPDGNYRTVTNRAFVTIKAAPIKPWNPTDPEDPEDPNPPEDPDPSGPYHAWAGAQNIIKCYDGIGTNIVAEVGPVAFVDPTIRYSTNKTDWVKWEDLQFTNVCTAVKVFFTVAKENYTTLTNHAFVTITNAVINPFGPKDPDDPTPPGEDPFGPGVPWAGAPNVIKTFDNIGTNILAEYGNILPDGTVPVIKYSTDPNGPFKARVADEFVNVTNVQVYFTVEAPNYATLTNSAWVTITDSPIKPLGPNDPDDPFEPPTDGSAWAGAKNIVKCYDGIATNIVAEYGAFKPDDSEVEVLYSLNQNGPFEARVADQFVNVTNGVPVYFTVTAPNYGTITNYACVTITNATICPSTPNDPISPFEPGPDPMNPGQAWAGAKNIVKCFDNTGTNIVAEWDNLIPSGTDPEEVLYSTNATDFVAWEALQFTNVCDGVQVFFTVKVDNYNVLTNHAFVTITNAVITPVGPGDDPEDPFEPPEDGTPWAGAPNIVKPFDNIGTNIIVTYDNILPEGTVPVIKYSTNPTGPFGAYDPVQFVNVTNVQVYYTFEVPNYGTLTNSAWVKITDSPITPLGPNDPDDPFEPPTDGSAWAGAKNIIKCYDGVATNIVAEYGAFKPDDSEVTVLYSLQEEGPFTDRVAHQFLAVTNAVPVWFTVTAPNYGVITNFAYVTITNAVIKKEGPNDPSNPNPPEHDPSDKSAWAGAPNIIRCFDNTGTNVIARYGNLIPAGITPEILYTTNKTEWVAWEALQLTNVCEAVEVFFTVKVDNYNILTNSAYVTITNAVITPVGPGDDPEDPFEPPEDGTPWAGAPNIVKPFDNIGTNIIVQYGNILPEGVVPVIQYSTDPNGPFGAYDPNQFVNVTNVQVYYTFEVPNYGTLTNSAWVKITDSPITPLPPNDPDDPFEPPADGSAWAGAKNIIKCYDGVATNIVAEYGAFKPDGIEVEVLYSLDPNGPFTARVAGQFVDVTNAVPVYFTVAAPNYGTITNYACVTITNAVITPFGPKNPDDPTPPGEDPFGPGVPWAGAQNIVKCFDNTGTNIVAEWGNLIPSGTDPEEVLYSTNATDFVAWEALQFTNVCDGVQVFFTVKVDNYNILTNSAFVTITNTMIKPVGPGTPEDPSQPGMPEPPTDGTPWAGATNIVKVYDGTGTNITAVYGNLLPDGVEVEVLYSLDPNGPFTARDPEQFVEICDPTPVYFTVTAPNYAVLTNMAYVTIVRGPIVPLGPNDPDEPFVPPTDGSAWAGAKNVVKTYDGIGTNIVAEYGQFVPDGVEVEVLYSLDKNGPFSARIADQFVAVTNHVPVYFTVSAANYGTITSKAFVTIKPQSLGPDPDDPTKPAPGIEMPKLPENTYDGNPYEPTVVVTNTLVNPAVELEEGKDYTIEYFNNTNATEEAYVVITGLGNYGGVYTNYFTILPREVWLQSGTCTTYLDPTRPGESVVSTNEFVWVFAGSFVTNAATQVEDGFVAVVSGRLEGSTEMGPEPNVFTATVEPGLPSNYEFVYLYGDLQILKKPTDAHDETHEEVPSADGKTPVDVVMDNCEAGPFAADKPPELNERGRQIVKDSLEQVEVRMLVSTNYLEESYNEVTNKAVEEARQEGKSEKEIKGYTYEAFDIAVNETHWFYRGHDDLIPTNTVVRDIGNEIPAEEMLTITIPYTFGENLKSFSVWRNHTNEIDGTERVIELPYYGTVPANTESFETNKLGVTLHAHKFSVYVFRSLYLSTPQLTGQIRWKYHRAESVFYGGVEVTCTNGNQAAISNLNYIFEDRPDCYLRALNSNELLSKTSFEIINGKRYGKVPLAEMADALRRSELDTTVTYGVDESTFASSRYVVPTMEERQIALVSTKIEQLANGNPSVVDGAMGYLTWQETGYDVTYWCALSPNLPPLSETDALVVSGQESASTTGGSASVANSAAVSAQSAPAAGTVYLDAFIAGIYGERLMAERIGWKVTGLPSGLRFDKKTGLIYGTPKKPGHFVLTFSAKVNRKTVKEKVELDVYQGNFPAGVPEGYDVSTEGIALSLDVDDETTVFPEGDGVVTSVGTTICWPIAADGLTGVATTLRAKGLPTGLKLSRAKDGTYSIKGKAKRAGSYNVTITATNKFKWTGTLSFWVVVVSAE